MKHLSQVFRFVFAVFGTSLILYSCAHRGKSTITGWNYNQVSDTSAVTLTQVDTVSLDSTLNNAVISVNAQEEVVMNAIGVGQAPAARAVASVSYDRNSAAIKAKRSSVSKSRRKRFKASPQALSSHEYRANNNSGSHQYAVASDQYENASEIVVAYDKLQIEDNSPTSGILTAGEVNDFSKWDLWSKVKNEKLAYEAITWGIHPKDRYTVQVVNQDQRPVVDAIVSLKSDKDGIIWQSRTDNTGKAELWSSLFVEGQKGARIEVNYEGVKKTFKDITTFKNGINIFEIKEECSISDKVDILFMVDATASMADEINYLKTELNDVLKSTMEQNTPLDIQLGSLFYRCEGNSYVTKAFPFTKDTEAVTSFIAEQSAAEGGDEAVEIALQECIEDFTWSEQARARILFIVLDEPPNSAHAHSLQMSIKEAAKKGIRIVPLVASNLYGSPNKMLEYLMRSAALATNGTYVFLTDHSGVGNSHAQPTTDEYDVELLNGLLGRLIRQYTYVPSCSDSEWKNDQQWTDTTEVKIIDHVILDSTQIEANLVLEAAAEEPDGTNEASALEAVARAMQEAVGQDTSEESKPKESMEPQVNEKAYASFKFYPNPTSGNINIELNEVKSNLFVLDMSGKVLEEIDINGQELVNIDISRYPNGFYSIGYRSGKKWFSGKVLLVH